MTTALCPCRYEEVQRAQEELGAGVVEVAAEARRALTAVLQENTDMAKKLLQVTALGQVSSAHAEAAQCIPTPCLACEQHCLRAGRCSHGAFGIPGPAAGTANTGWSPGTGPGSAGAGSGCTGAISSGGCGAVPGSGSQAGAGAAEDLRLPAGSCCSLTFHLGAVLCLLPEPHFSPLPSCRTGLALPVARPPWLSRMAKLCSPTRSPS